MTVRRYDHALRFLVSSESRDLEFLCDFSELDEFPLGRCGCERFQFVHEPAMREGTLGRCKHLKHVAGWMKKRLTKARLDPVT